LSMNLSSVLIQKQTVMYSCKPLVNQLQQDGIFILDHIELSPPVKFFWSVSKNAGNCFVARHYLNTIIIMDSFQGMIHDFDAIVSMDSFLDVLADFGNGVKTLTKDLKSQDVNQVTELVNLLIKGMKSIASAFQVINTEDLNDPDLLREFHKLLLQLTEFDAKLAYMEMDREEAFKYPRLTTRNCGELFKMLESSIEYFADFVFDASPGMRACIPSFTKLVATFTSIVMEYFKLCYRHIAMQVEGVVE
ncbi:hypothetical protein FAGAP_13419, partial [Fusarium agapanthi]